MHFYPSETFYLDSDNVIKTGMIRLNSINPEVNAGYSHVESDTEACQNSVKPKVYMLMFLLRQKT